MSNSAFENTDTLFCFYDVLNSPITFDFLQFLAVSEGYRQHQGFTKIQFIITSGEEGAFRRQTEKDHAMSQSQKIWRLRHILETACWVVPSCCGVWTCVDRAVIAPVLAGIPKDNIFPVGFGLETPKPAFLMRHVKAVHQSGIDVQVLKASQSARGRVRDWIATQKIDRPIVALSMRYSPLFKEKNVDLEGWRAFQSYLVNLGYQPVVVPDTYLALRGAFVGVASGVPVFYQGSLDFELRAAFFDEAFATVSKHGGPAMYTMLHRGARCLLFLGARANPSEEAFENIWDIKWGDQPPWAAPVQRLIYENDSFETLSAHFQQLLQSDADQATAPS
jgi:hypothetical protein